jgi:hypothetical protein
MTDWSKFFDRVEKSDHSLLRCGESYEAYDRASRICFSSQRSLDRSILSKRRQLPEPEILIEQARDPWIVFAGSVQARQCHSAFRSLLPLPSIAPQ